MDQMNANPARKKPHKMPFKVRKEDGVLLILAAGSNTTHLSISGLTL
jgi:hypothetical protein